MECLVLVTGGAGFIGSRLVTHLAREHPGAVVAADLSMPPGGAVPSGVIFRLADLGDPRETAALVAEVRPRCVVHLAAVMGVRECAADPEGCRRINVDALGFLLESCLEAGVGRFVFASSASVYGTSRAPFVEGRLDDEPSTLHALSKLEGERMVADFAERRGLASVILRIFNVFGEGQRPDRVMLAMLERLVAGEAAEVVGSPDWCRDYLHVDDCVAALAAAARVEGHFHVVNVGSGHAVTNGRLVELLAARVGVPPLMRVLPPRPGDMHVSCADTTRMREVLGFTPRLSLDEGLDRLVAWYLGRCGCRSRIGGGA